MKSYVCEVIPMIINAYFTSPLSRHLVKVTDESVGGDEVGGRGCGKQGTDNQKTRGDWGLEEVSGE